ncbi:hypothetical protein [Methanosarcina mazei]|uniref:hypothetical protein n=1 Tax=Methanosarcina mazei TaxID=2209 RepID=UPI000AFF4F3F|nr:hypothetical protein [Methanosarcina mazei]
MQNMSPTDLSFLSWATQTYAEKKEAVDFLERSNDPFDRAIGTLIKKYAGGEQNTV